MWGVFKGEGKQGARSTIGPSRYAFFFARTHATHTPKKRTQNVELAAKGLGHLRGERAALRRVGDVGDGAGDAPAARPPLRLAALDVGGAARAEKDLFVLVLVGVAVSVRECGGVVVERARASTHTQHTHLGAERAEFLDHGPADALGAACDQRLAA